MLVHGYIARSTILLIIGLVMLASGDARGDLPKGGDYFYGGIHSAKTGGKLCLFFYATRSGFVSPKPDLGRRVLAAITSDASELDDLVSLSHVLTDEVTIEGHPVKTMLRAGVFPSPAATIAAEPVKDPDPVRFQPAGIRSIRELRKRFGPSTDREQWSGGIADQLGVSGIVEWWGSSGVHAGADGTISHVLVRVRARGE